jgi:hypothetical protein
MPPNGRPLEEERRRDNNKERRETVHKGGREFAISNFPHQETVLVRNGLLVRYINKGKLHTRLEFEV